MKKEEDLTTRAINTVNETIMWLSIMERALDIACVRLSSCSKYSKLEWKDTLINRAKKEIQEEKQ